MHSCDYSSKAKQAQKVGKKSLSVFVHSVVNQLRIEMLQLPKLAGASMSTTTRLLWPSAFNYGRKFAAKTAAQRSIFSHYFLVLINSKLSAFWPPF